MRRARGYAGYGLQLGDLIQEGNVGLMKAVKRFDPNVGVRLVSFAVHWIRAEIHEFVLRNWRLVKRRDDEGAAQAVLQPPQGEEAPRLAQPSDETEAVAKRPRRDAARGQRDGAAAERLRRVVRPGSRRTTRTSRPAAYLPSPNSDPAQLGRARRLAADAHDRLDGALGKLDDRSRDILARRWLTDDKATLHELAAEYDVSAERIRQIEANAIAKLASTDGASA